jgi:hypothetical protein
MELHPPMARWRGLGMSLKQFEQLEISFQRECNRLGTCAGRRSLHSSYWQLAQVILCAFLTGFWLSI